MNRWTLSQAVKTLYAAPKLHPWSSLSVLGGIPLSAGKSDDGAVGFMPIYDSLEEYQKNYPNDEPIILRVKETEQ